MNCIPKYDEKITKEKVKGKNIGTRDKCKVYASGPLLK